MKLRRFSLAALALAFSASSALPAAAASPEGVGSCYTPTEVRASQLRQLQTELMVAALSCNHADLGFREKYNAFVHKFGKNLNDNAKVLRTHFSRNYGSEQARRFDSYITALANEASVRSVGEATYCESAYQLYEAVSSLGPREIEDFAARTVKAETAVAPCAKTRR
ncbi:hypothetical protein [Telmatospirillum sp. J64-1]|uniref:hypothetical protein n=1 Tax=Telmatospirillum sp. J64-1 TaxID=2502183 RepID=UPI00115E26D2|nr:hypothetical protein [Telmatospirillum sp. J64-1]